MTPAQVTAMIACLAIMATMRSSAASGTTNFTVVLAMITSSLVKSAVAGIRQSSRQQYVVRR